MIDAFPHTRRPLPWIVAAFLVMLFIVPVDATTVNIHLPVDSQIHRCAVVIVILLWCVLGGDQKTIWRSNRSKVFVAAVAIYLAVEFGGVIAASPRIIRLDEWSLVQKQAALSATFFLIGWFVLSALRPNDLRGLSTLILALGTILAVGMLIESHTGYNVFYSVSRTVLKPVATVGPTPTQLNGALTYDGRPVIVGSTMHGLAAVSVLASVMGFALIRMFEARSRRTWVLYGLAFALMAAAAVSTQKKTSVVVLLAVILFVGAHRPRKLLRLLPLGVVLVGAIHALAPGSIGTVLNPSLWFNSNSSAHRSNDIPTIWPDIITHPILGLGSGSANPDQPDQYRILDDAMLAILWEMGVVGLLAFIAMILAPIVDARKARRSRDPDLAQTAIAASAGCVAFFVVSFLFDSLSFSEAPYLFFILAGFCVVASGAAADERPPVLVESPPRRVAVTV